MANIKMTGKGFKPKKTVFSVATKKVSKEKKIKFFEKEIKKLQKNKTSSQKLFEITRAGKRLRLVRANTKKEAVRKFASSVKAKPSKFRIFSVKVKPVIE